MLFGGKLFPPSMAASMVDGLLERLLGLMGLVCGSISEKDGGLLLVI